MSNDSNDANTAGAAGAMRWVTTPDEDSLELFDPLTGRSALVVRPPDDVLVMDSLVRLEGLATAWGSLVTQEEADRELLALLHAEPYETFVGLSWMVALWCVACEVRTGISAVEGARGLDYHGPWRPADDPEAARLWQALTQRVRIGVLAALTEDERAVDAYREATTTPANVGPALLRHTVVLMDGFFQDMRRNGLDPRGLIASFAAQTRPTTRPRRCFGMADRRR